MKAVSVKTQNGTGKLLKWLEGLYEKYNRREYVHPDPVELLYAYGDVRDREIAGIVAAALAYGRAALIIKSAGSVLDVLGLSPAASLSEMTDAELMRSLKGFRHRFTTGFFRGSERPLADTKPWRPVSRKVSKRVEVQ
jgi:hypothetical protein